MSTFSGMHSTLVATRMSGTLDADVATAESVRADLSQADLALDFAATVTGRRIDVERFAAAPGRARSRAAVA